MTEPRPGILDRIFDRSCQSLFGAVSFGLLAALVDSAWAVRAQPEPPSLLNVASADAGLLVPLALVCGIWMGLLSSFLHPGAPSARRLALALRDPDSEQRAYVAALAPLSALGTALFIVVDAKATLHFFAMNARPPVIALGAGLTACITALLIALLVFASARGVAKAWQSPPDPLTTGLLGLIVAAAILAWAIGAGETSGAGGFFGLFGVLKRPELDLRAPALVLAVVVGAYVTPALVQRVPSLLLVGLALLPLGLTVRSAGHALEERRVAVALERNAPLGKLALAAARKVTDRDHDGFSSRFGGGDCNDRDPSVNPRALDVPGDGRDEDCSGHDDVAVSLKAAGAATNTEAGGCGGVDLPRDLGVVLITVDTLRADLGYAGNPRPVSANLDRLAQRSVVFDKAYSLASYTSKSLPPLLIGKYPSETHRGFLHFNRFSSEDTFIQERLARAHVRTVSVQGYWYFFNEGFGFERGFDVLDSRAAPKIVQIEGDRTSNSDKISDAALERLKDPINTQGPFFFWIHYIDPHAEYMDHEKFHFGSTSRDRYDSEVAFVDEQLGRVLGFIEQSPLAKRTAIIVTSDHGEAFMEHNMIRHGFELWEELVHVPLLVSVPGLPPRHIRERRSAIDLVPTLLDLYRSPAPSGRDSDFLSGQSLLPELCGATPKPRIVFIDMPAGPHNAERQAFIENDLKLVTSDMRPLGLYNLSADPEEKRDLLDDPDLKEKVLGRFKAFRRNLRTVEVKPTR